jgi:RimJ/RimL family protein N-acetyltransferase
MKILHLDKSSASQQIIKDFISTHEHLLPDPFSLHVDLNAYAEKLNTFGDTFVVSDNDKIVGLVSGYINDITTKEAYLQIIIVAREAQGKGYATLLIHEFVNCAKNRFTSGKVYLTVDRINEKAANVYKHLGFVKSERQHANINKQIMVYNF